MDEELIQLKDEMNYSLRKASEIVEQTADDGTHTPEQEVEISQLRATAAECKKRILAIEKANALKVEVAQDYADVTKPQARKVPQAPPGHGEGYEFKHFEVPSVSPRRHASFRGSDGARDAYKSGLWAVEAIFGSHPDYREHQQVKEARRIASEYFPEIRAMSTVQNADGGATVPTEFMDAIIDRREQFGTFETLTNRVPMGNRSVWPRVTSDDMATFGAEGTEITEVDPTFDNVTLNSKALRTLSRVNNKLLDESIINIAEWLAKEFGRRFAKRIDTAGFIGDASEANGGITGVYTQVSNNTSFTSHMYYKPTSVDNFGDVTTVHLANMLGRLAEYAMKGQPFWITNQAGKELCFGRLQMASGGVTKQETSIGTFDSYSGVPIVTSQVITGTGADFTNNDVMLVLADLQLGSYMGVSKEMEIARSGERYFEFNQTGVRGVMNTDINVYDIGSATKSGSIVGLVSD